jgi:hypothetical protein
MMIRPVQKIVRFTAQNNEHIGIYTEKVVCECQNVEFNTKRKQTFPLPIEASSAMTTDIMKCVANLPKIAKHVGGNNQAPDFELHDGRHLSVKSLYSSNKVAPQNIGQASESVLKTKLNIEFDSFKSYFLSHLGQMLQSYIKYLFSSEVMLAMNYKMGKGYIIQVIDMNNVSLNLQGYHLDTSRSLETWNESNTIYLVNPLAEDKKQRKISIAEIQVHNHRSCCKFRFNLENLIAYNLVNGINISTIELEHKYRIKTMKKEIKEANASQPCIDNEIERLSNLNIAP